MGRHLRTAAFCLCVFVGCASQPEVAPEDPTDAVGLGDDSAILNESVTRISIATPESLELAMLDLSVSDAGDSARGLELHNVAADLFDILYPLLEAPPQPPAPFSPTSLFPEIFAAVREGRYAEVPQESVSFLTLVIPPLAALGQSGRSIEERSKETLLQAEALNPQSIIPDLVIGSIERRNANYEEARERFESALDKSNRAYTARIGLARVDLAVGRYADAIESLEELLDELPPSVAVLELQARAYFLTGRNSEADSIIQDAITLETDNSSQIGLILLRAQILAASGDYAGARRLLSIVERRRPEDPDVLLLKAELLAEEDQFEEALTVIKRARELHPQNNRIRDTYGRLLVRAGNVDEGREILEESLEQAPANIGNLTVLLEEAVSSERWEEAAEYVDRLLEIDSRDEYLDLAIDISVALGDVSAATRYAATRYSQRPDNMVILKQYARLLIETDDLDTAEEVLNRGMEIVDNSSDESVLLYLQSYLTDNVEERMRLLQLSLFKELQNFDALLAYATALEQSGDTARALRYIKEAAKIRPEDEEVQQMIQRLQGGG